MARPTCIRNMSKLEFKILYCRHRTFGCTTACMAVYLVCSSPHENLDQMLENMYPTNSSGTAPLILHTIKFTFNIRLVSWLLSHRLRKQCPSMHKIIRLVSAMVCNYTWADCCRNRPDDAVMSYMSVVNKA